VLRALLPLAVQLPKQVVVDGGGGLLLLLLLLRLGLSLHSALLAIVVAAEIE